METATIDLKAFCGKTSSYSRFRTDDPWVSGEWVYATDMKIAVRVPHHLEVPIGPCSPEAKRPDMDKMHGNPFGQFPLTGAIPIPVLPLSKSVRCEV